VVIAGLPPQEDPIATLKRQAMASGEHTELMAQDQQLNVASNMITIATHSQQTQKLAEGEVEKREQHRNSRAGGWGALILANVAAAAKLPESLWPPGRVSVYQRIAAGIGINVPLRHELRADSRPPAARQDSFHP